ncbi:MAG: hypothetical protein JEZ14_07425 [Marinilabiliaceae bacterium]|nr:hypothetical protein [Marinilabiliaceae bacterium]
MPKSLIITIALMIVTASLKLEAQSCKHLLDATSPVDTFYTNKMVYLYKIPMGKTIKLTRVLYSSTSYNLNIIKDDQEKKIALKVIDSKTQNVFWDNAKENYNPDLNICFGSTRRVTIEISAIKEDYQSSSDCVAFIIKSLVFDSFPEDEVVPEPPTPNW